MRNISFSKSRIINIIFLITISAGLLNCQKKDPTNKQPDLHDTLDGDPVSYFGPLKVSGNRITDMDGKSVQLSIGYFSGANGWVNIITTTV